MSIHLSKIRQGKSESLTDAIRRFHQEAILILDLDGVSYASFLNGLKNEHFKFSLTEYKEMTFANLLQKGADFIKASEIYTENHNGTRRLRSDNHRPTKSMWRAQKNEQD